MGCCEMGSSSRDFLLPMWEKSLPPGEDPGVSPKATNEGSAPRGA